MKSYMGAVVEKWAASALSLFVRWLVCQLQTEIQGQLCREPVCVFVLACVSAQACFTPTRSNEPTCSLGVSPLIETQTSAQQQIVWSNPELCQCAAEQPAKPDW